MRAVLLLLNCFLFISLNAKDIVLNSNIDIAKQLNTEGGNYIVKSTTDLKGKVVELPANSTIIFQEGMMKNGTLVGNKSKISYSGTIFSAVKIKGSWNIPILHSTMFQDAQEMNVLNELIALSDDCLTNTIYIHQGEYFVSASANTKGAIELRSKTKLVINAFIKLIPNDFPGCSAISVKNVSDITISGNGSIIGDKDAHKGKDGEWGMGIQIMNSKNVTINGLNISNCWGDCIYIGGKSSYINIVNCNLHHARRQGISVTNAYKCKIDNCKIYDIAGTAPEYGIDFEPNTDCTVNAITVSNTEVYNCGGGIMAGIKGGNAENAMVGNITISQCYIHDLRTKNTFRWHNCSNITVTNCSIDKPIEDCTFKVEAKKVKYKNIIRK